MGRRRRQSPAEDITDLVALMPWWAGVALAAVSYLVLHRLATPPVVTAAGPTADLLTKTVIAGLATGGQYLLPFLCCLGALISFLRRRRRAGLLDRATGASAAASLASMSWREFELLVGEAYRQGGYQVTETGGGGSDGGIDLVLRRGSEKVLVQCKHWRAVKVGVPIVRELVGVMTAEGATGGIVVTGGDFTPEARAFAAGCKVELIDGPALGILLQQARMARSARPATRGRPTPAPVASAAAHAGVPACPTCQSPMVWRTARKGASAGSQFWGCSRYPACRGTR